MDDETIRSLAGRFTEAIAKRDLAALRNLFSPSAVFWTNVGRTETPLEQRLQGIALEFRIFEEFRFEDLRCHPYSDGFALQMTARGRTTRGDRFEFPMCAIARVENGRLERLDEYVDAAPIAAILKAMQETAAASQ
jgi:ketosteroid isomerase-like protein